MSVFSMDNAPKAVRRGLRIPVRIKTFIKRNIADQAITAVTWVLAAFSAGIGISLIFTPEAAHHAPPFSFNFQVAPPHVWGFGFLFLGVWIAISLSAKNEPKLPCYFIGMLSGVWGILTVADIIVGNVPATAFIAYVTMGLVAFICGIAYEDFDEDEVRA